MCAGRAAAPAPDACKPKLAGNSMRRVTSNTLRQARNALGRPLLTGTEDEGTREVSGDVSLSPRDASKASFRLLVCNDDTCDVLLPNGPAAEIRRELSARSMTKLTWLTPPRTALIVKKPNDDGAEEALCRVAAFLKAEGLKVLVEPAVAAATGCARGCADTWTPEQAALLGNCVDFCVCLGGDGTILWAAGLFGKGVPPVISYAMGSLGFLTPFVIEDHHRSLRMVLGGEFQVTLRARLACRIIRAADAARADAAPAAADEAWSEAPSFTVLNEVVVDRGPSHSLVELDCFCDGMPMTKIQGAFFLYVCVCHTLLLLPWRTAIYMPSAPCATQLTASSLRRRRGALRTALRPAAAWFTRASARCCSRPSARMRCPAARCCYLTAWSCACACRRRRAAPPGRGLTGAAGASCSAATRWRCACRPTPCPPSAAAPRTRTGSAPQRAASTGTCALTRSRSCSCRAHTATRACSAPPAARPCRRRTDCTVLQHASERALVNNTSAVHDYAMPQET